MTPLRLGGFVIHGNNAGSLEGCLSDLLAVCDRVVAVDSCSSDGSAEIAARYGVMSVRLPWQGYGAARAKAVELLSDCDYLFFLDSDERLGSSSQQALRQWRVSRPRLPYYLLRRRDWARLRERKFVYRTESHIRAVRRDAALWSSRMIVHEGLPPGKTGRIDAVIEHSFATSVSELIRKQESYALLWAVRAFCEARKPGIRLFRRQAHLLRDGLVKGAVFRGGLPALRLAWDVSRHHLRKHQLLHEIQQGAYPDLTAAWREGRFEDLFVLVRSYLPLAVSPPSVSASPRPHPSASR